MDKGPGRGRGTAESGALRDLRELELQEVRHAGLGASPGDVMNKHSPVSRLRIRDLDLRALPWLDHERRPSRKSSELAGEHPVVPVEGTEGIGCLDDGVID